MSKSKKNSTLCERIYKVERQRSKAIQCSKKDSPTTQKNLQQRKENYGSKITQRQRCMSMLERRKSTGGNEVT